MPARPGHSTLEPMSKSYLIAAPTRGLLAEIGRGLTVYNAVSPDRTMEFLAIGIGLDVPLILFYTWYAHYAFRGKRASAPEPRDLTRT